MEKRTLILASSCAAFLGLGMATGGVGPALADLAKNSNASLADVGGVFSGLFAGALVAQLFAGGIYDRFGAKPVLLVGLTLLGIGTLTYTFSTSLTMLLMLSLFTGIGHGCVDISVTVNISGLFADKRTAILNLLNVFFGIGAVMGPAIASLSLSVWNTALPGLWAGAVMALVQVPVLMVLLETRRANGEESPHESSNGLYRVPLLWLFAVFILIYVGVENAIGGWTTTYVQRTNILNAETGALLTAGFWLMLTAGRLVTALLSSRTTPAQILWWSIVGSLAGGILLLIGVGNLPLTIAAVLLLGFSYGPVFPTAMSLVTARFALTPGRAAAAVMAFASIGGATIPNLHGVLLERISPEASSLYEAVLAIALIVLVLALLRMQSEKQKMVIA